MEIDEYDRSYLLDLIDIASPSERTVNINHVNSTLKINNPILCSPMVSMANASGAAPG